MKKQQLKDKSLNVVSVLIFTEAGCDFDDGEYTAEISGFVGTLDISSNGGVDDVSLVKEAIEEEIDASLLPKEGVTQVMLEETGEWEDVFWHKYYRVKQLRNISQDYAEDQKET